MLLPLSDLLLLPPALSPVLLAAEAAGGGGQQQQQPGAGASPAGGLFVCEVCLQCFPSRQLLEGHSAAAHWPHPGAGQGEQGPQQRKYACSFCPYTTNVRTNVVTHERTHTGEKPYACGVCCRAFSQMSSLLAHQAIHNRQGSYECAECGHACASRSSLAQHRRRRHPHSSARGQGGDGGQQLRAGGTPSERAPSRPRQRTTPSRQGQNGAGETPPGPQHDEGAPIAVELPGDKVGPSMSGQQSPRHFLDEVPYMLPYAPAAAPGHLQDGHHPLHLGAFGGSACPHWGVGEGCREEGDAQRQGQ